MKSEEFIAQNPQYQVFHRKWEWVNGLGPGLLVLGGSAAMSLLSYSFTYGEGHSERPILWFLLAYAVIWLGFFHAVRRIRTSQGVSVALILLIGSLSRIALLPSNLIQENDVYRYVFDGHNLLSGENPYRLSPTEIRHDPTHPLRDDLAGPEASLVLDRIGFPEVPTVYPPAAQVTFAVGVLVKDWDWRGQRVLFLVIDVLVILALLQVQRALGVAREWIVLYAWNPLVLKEVANSAHLDVLLCLQLALLMLVLTSSRRRVLTPILAGTLLGLLTLTKLYPLLLLPVLAVWLYRRFQSLTSALVCVAAAGLVVGAGYLPFLGDGVRPLFRGLSIYGQYWVMNEGAFSLLSLVTDQARVVVVAVMALISLLTAWWFALPGGRSLVMAAQLVLLLWLLLIPTPYPWYSLPLLALACLNPDSAVGRTTLGLSLLLALYYLSFYFEYRESPEWLWTLARSLEHAGIWGCFLWAAWPRRRGFSESRTQITGSPSRR